MTAITMAVALFMYVREYHTEQPSKHRASMFATVFFAVLTLRASYEATLTGGWWWVAWSAGAWCLVGSAMWERRSR